jgi:Uma2 family endonuclease
MSALYVPHAEAHTEIILWLGAYKAATPGLRVLDNATVVLADDGEPQPDACMILPPERGGQTRIEDEKLLVGAPELVVEVAYSRAAYDLHSKKADYERAGVREYVVLVLREAQVLWFVRRGERFEELAPGEDGLLRSEFFPGLWLDPAAMLRGDTNAVRAALEQGLGTSEHAAFAGR